MRVYYLQTKYRDLSKIVGAIATIAGGIQPKINLSTLPTNCIFVVFYKIGSLFFFSFF
jgi:hypothetical protein